MMISLVRRRCRSTPLLLSKDAFKVSKFVSYLVQTNSRSSVGHSNEKRFRREYGGTRGTFSRDDSSPTQLVHSLRKYENGPLKFLLQVVDAIKEAAHDTESRKELMNSGAMALLLRLLDAGPSAAKGKVSLCIYQIHSKSAKSRRISGAFENNLHLHSVATVSSFFADQVVAKKCVVHFVDMVKNKHQSIAHKKQAMDALLHLTWNNPILIDALLDFNVVEALGLLVSSDEEDIAIKASALLSFIMRTRKYYPPDQAIEHINSMVYFLLLSCSESVSEKWDELSRIQIRNSCSSCLAHLSSHSVCREAIWNAGGLKIILNLYDQNLRPVDGENKYDVAVNQSRLVQILQALSNNQCVIRDLFDSGRFDVLFGYMRNGYATPRELIVLELAARLRHLPSYHSLKYRILCSSESDDALNEDGNEKRKIIILESPHRSHQSGEVGKKEMFAESVAEALLQHSKHLDILVAELNSSMKVQRATMLALCELIDYSNDIAHFVLFRNERHRALESISAILKTCLETDESIDSSGEILDHPGPPPFHQSALDQDNDGADSHCPSLQVSGLYALHLLASYSTHCTSKSAGQPGVALLSQLWLETAVPILVDSFFNQNGRISLRGRKYAALALCELCLDPIIREHLITTNPVKGDGVNFFDVLELFLEEEIYSKV